MRASGASIRHGDYRFSRTPGSLLDGGDVPSAADDFADAYEHSLRLWACANDWWGGGSEAATVP